jgi:hypothetical protein
MALTLVEGGAFYHARLVRQEVVGFSTRGNSASFTR